MRPHQPSLVDTDPEDIEEPFDYDPEEAGPLDDEDDIVEGDIGDLYGVHLPAASDTKLAAREDEDGYRDSTLGEHFFESLDQHATEGGPEPEHVIDVIDDDPTRRFHPKSDQRDRPIADKGAGGPGGR